MVKVGTTSESELVLRDQPIGVEISITVTAYNDAGESQPSEAAKISLG